MKCLECRTGGTLMLEEACPYNDGYCLDCCMCGEHAPDDMGAAVLYWRRQYRYARRVAFAIGYIAAFALLALSVLLYDI